MESEKYSLIVELLGGTKKDNATIDDVLNVLAEKTATEITGTEITLTDSLNLPASVEITEIAEGTTSKNKLNIKNENARIVNADLKFKDNTVTLTTIEDFYSRYQIPFKYKLNTVYTLSFKATFLSGLDVAAEPVVYFRKDQVSTGVVALIKDNETHKYFVNVEFTEEGFDLWLYMKSLNIGGDISIKFEDIQIEEGTVATEYEPYGVTNIEVCNKNVLNLKDLRDSKEQWNVVPAYYKTLKLKPNTKYTCSSNVPKAEDTGNVTKNPLYFNGQTWSAVGVSEGNPKTTTTDEYGYLYIAVCKDRPNAEELINGDYYIQIEEGTEATEYKPHKSQKYQIPLEVGAKKVIETYNPVTHIKSVPTIKLNYKKAM